MHDTLRRWFPEIFLALLAAFFFLRELGIFPSPWTDDSLFMIVAREIAEGEGYGISILGRFWPYPSFLAVGPGLLLPVALFVKLFGFSVAVARLPMVLYLAATTVCMYFIAKRVGGRMNALWAVALLITLSAFVNTGKPVMGEVPGFFFFLAGVLLLWPEESEKWRSILGGVLFGLSVLTKLSYVLVFGVLAIAWLSALLRRDKRDIACMTVVTCTAAMVVALGSYAMGFWSPGFIPEVKRTLLGASGDTTLLSVLRNQPELLLRLPYLAFVFLLTLAIVGFSHARRTVPTNLSVMLWSFIALFTFYFLSRYGWYRHLLPAHLALIPFVPMGVRVMFRRPIASAMLVAVVAAQGFWQLTYQGSPRSSAGVEAAVYVQEHFADAPLIIQRPEVYVHLPRRGHWLFLTNPVMTLRLPKEMVGLSEEKRCMPMLTSLSEEEKELFTGRITEVAKRYVLLGPPENCPSIPMTM